MPKRKKSSAGTRKKHVRPGKHQALRHIPRAVREQLTPRTVGSWWAEAPRDGFTTVALDEHVPRMSSSDVRPYGSTDTYLIKNQ
jgi:hypothetical protein